ncbi:MAG: hypothetical protein NTW87_10425 [Planctomycetota bacterium]|nr:hypothetical protein [Planctomycetota bacterium]
MNGIHGTGNKSAGTKHARRRDSGGNPALLILNASIDAAEDVQVCVCGGGESLHLLHADGHKERLARKDQDGPYAVYRIERIGPWQAALVSGDENT